MSEFINRIKNSSLIKDSLWAVFGNGLGNFLLLLAGIIIARILGKDIYGEYGLVKTTMFHIASFSTLGLGFTSTRFIARYKENDIGLLKGTVYSALLITTITSLILCTLLLVFSIPLAEYLEEPQLYIPFRFLGVIIVVKAICTTSSALLAGNKNFKIVGINTIISGISMLLFSILLTYYWGLKGSLAALAISQVVLCMLNIRYVRSNLIKPYMGIVVRKNYSDILKFTFPVALQELSYTLSQWGMMLILTKYGSLGEVGLFSAASQWNAIILFIPALLSNVVLSYLSSTSKKNQDRTLQIMLFANFLTTLIPFLSVLVFSDLIVSFYGDSFVGLKVVINILVFSTIFDCMSRVFQSNLIAIGKNWSLFVFRAIRDASLLLFSYIVLSQQPINTAQILSIIYLVVCIVFFILLFLEHISCHSDA